MTFASNRVLMVAAAAAGLTFAQKPPEPAKPSGAFGPAEIHSIYLLPMGSGLDQYLATQLVRKGFYKVVTDPALADAILTDRVGQPLESKLNELYPKPEVEEPAPPPPPPPANGKKLTDADKEEAQQEATRKSSEKALDRARSEWMAQRGNFARGRGNIYLVDRYNRNVLWSIYERPKSTQPDGLNKTAGRIVSELEKLARPKK